MAAPSKPAEDPASVAAPGDAVGSGDARFSPGRRGRPSLLRFFATGALGVLVWVAVSYMAAAYWPGADVGSQLGSGWFWLALGAVVLVALVRWFRYSARDAEPGPDAGGGHGLVSAERRPRWSRQVQRLMIVYVAMAAVLLVAIVTVDTPGRASGRSLLSEDAAEQIDYYRWARSWDAYYAEMWGLQLYEWALVVGAVFIALELVALFVRRRRDRRLWFLDSAASLSTQVPFYLVEVFAAFAMLAAYFFLWDRVALWQLPINGWTVVLAVVAADFAYYWEHRTSHEIRLLWTGHAVHHSSPIFNTAVAFRFGPLEPVVAILFHLPLIMLGLHPALVILGELSVQAYQFWIHTDVIGRLGPLDKFLNTPSNHRVHHGSDGKYLDKNHGGILVIWDRMFGTYQAEEETPTYGLTTPIDTVNPFKVWTSEFGPLLRDMRTARTWREWFGFLLNPPGWQPSNH